MSIDGERASFEDMMRTVIVSQRRRRPSKDGERLRWLTVFPLDSCPQKVKLRMTDHHDEQGFGEEGSRLKIQSLQSITFSQMQLEMSMCMGLKVM